MTPPPLELFRKFIRFGRGKNLERWQEQVNTLDFPSMWSDDGDVA